MQVLANVADSTLDKFRSNLAQSKDFQTTQGEIPKLVKLQRDQSLAARLHVHVHVYV